MSLELAPATPDDIAVMPLQQRGEMITRALVESKSWLAVATKGTDPAPIAEFKAWAATVAEMTRQKNLAADIQLDALEMVRRAERGIGVAIRNGQEAGDINRPGQHVGNQFSSGTHGGNQSSTVRQVSEFASFDELSGNGAGIYHLTDGVTDEQFEDAISEAREEHNLTRANVVRKLQAVPDLPARGLEQRSSRARPSLVRCRQISDLAGQGYSSRQISQTIGISAERVRELARREGIEIRADQVMARVSDVDPVRVVNATVRDLASSLEVTWSLLRPEDFKTFAPDDIAEWVESLDRSIQQLRKLRKGLCCVNTR